MKTNKLQITHTSFIVKNKNGKVKETREARNFNNYNELLKSCDIGLSTVVLKKIYLIKDVNFQTLKQKKTLYFG